MTISILKAVLVLVTLAVMILVLIGINHLFSGNFDLSQSDIDDMRHDLNDKEDVITENSVFNELVKVTVKDRKTLE